MDGVDSGGSPLPPRAVVAILAFAFHAAVQTVSWSNGELAEWLKAHDWKSCMRH